MRTQLNRYFKKIACSACLLSIFGAMNPAHAEFGFGSAELSPLRIAISTNSDEYAGLSGTIIFELPNASTELAIPIFWSSQETNEFIFLDEANYNGTTFDVQWRTFENPTRNGGYIGLLLRGFRGTIERNETGKETQFDYGVGAVAGYRWNITRGLYYGANASIAFISNGDDSSFFDEHEFLTQKVSFSLDFLKIGYKF